MMTYFLMCVGINSLFCIVAGYLYMDRPSKRVKHYSFWIPKEGRRKLELVPPARRAQEPPSRQKVEIPADMTLPPSVRLLVRKKENDVTAIGDSGGSGAA